jgi:serine/threonine protein kinase
LPNRWFREADVDGTPFGRYRLIELLGRGGMGEVWRAHDTATDRVVAIKLLPAHFSDNEDFQRRFRREAHSAGRLDSPHVIPIYDYGEIDGRLYVCMRLIKGRDLQTVLADGPLEPSRAVRIIEHVALALHAAHKIGLLHRDVKPSNILLDENDFAYLIDFGIARAADETRLTKSGNAVGTFQYIAPERLGTREEEDARADIYSLACVLYECLTGHPPFDEATMARLMAAHINTPPPKPSTTQPSVPAQIDQVIATGMAKDPDHRYSTTVELADAARNAITVPMQRPTPTPAPHPPTERPRSPLRAPRIPHATPPQPGSAVASAASPVSHAPTDRAFSPAAAEDHRAGSLVPPPRPAPPPIRVPHDRRLKRRTKIVLAVGAVGAVVLVAAVVGVVALAGHQKTSTTGHQTSSTGQSALPDAATLLKQSSQTTRDLKSAHLEMSVQGRVAGLPLKTLSGDLTNSPAAASKGHEQIALGGSDVDADFVELDGTLYASLDPGSWTDFGAASNIYELSAILNPDTGLANILSNFTNPTAEGRETINGLQTIKITGQVSADAVNKIFPRAATGETVPGTAWIREDGSHELVQVNLEPSSGSSIQMTLSKWNDPVSVVKPPGV